MKYIRLLSATGDESIDLFFYGDDKVIMNTRSNDHLKIRYYNVEEFNISEEEPCVSPGQDVSGIFEDLRRVNVELAEQGVQFNGRLKEVEEITETQRHEIESLETEVLMLNQLVTRLRSDIEAIYKQL